MTLELIVVGAIVLIAVCLLLLVAMLILTLLVRNTRMALPKYKNDYVVSELLHEEETRTTLRGKLTLWFLVGLATVVIYLGYFGPVLLFAAQLPGRP